MHSGPQTNCSKPICLKRKKKNEKSSNCIHFNQSSYNLPVMKIHTICSKQQTQYGFSFSSLEPSPKINNTLHVLSRLFWYKWSAHIYIYKHAHKPVQIVGMPDLKKKPKQKQSFVFLATTKIKKKKQNTRLSSKCTFLFFFLKQSRGTRWEGKLRYKVLTKETIKNSLRLNISFSEFTCNNHLTIFY